MIEKKNWHKRLEALGPDDYPGVTAIIETRIRDLDCRIAREQIALQRNDPDVQ